MVRVVLDEAMTYQRLCPASVWVRNPAASFEYVASGDRGTLPSEPLFIETSETIYCYAWNLPAEMQFPSGTKGVAWECEGAWEFASSDTCIEDDPDPESEAE